MIARLILIIFAINFSVLADEDKVSLSLLNTELKKNYSFVERSLNQSAMKIDNSSGKIFFDESGITINVLTPFEENYRIEDGMIEIHDLFLDQKQVINVEQANNFFLNILIEGIDENNPSYKVNIVENDIIEIMSIEQKSVVSFLFFKNRLELIRYTDSIGVEHGIELRPL
tara:strand:- start:74 stop:586 length:513 start_codon:yes stop_codon:yes gene_type:complete